jgi:hypothetical protein
MEKIEKSTTNIPEKRFRVGTISATVWQNQGKNKGGDPVAYRTVSVQRGYKDKGGEWQNTTSLRTNDLPKVSVVLQKAYEYILFNSQSSNEIPEVAI